MGILHRSERLLHLHADELLLGIVAVVALTCARLAVCYLPFSWWQGAIVRNATIPAGGIRRRVTSSGGTVNGRRADRCGTEWKRGSACLGERPGSAHPTDCGLDTVGARIWRHLSFRPLTAETIAQAVRRAGIVVPGARCLAQALAGICLYTFFGYQAVLVIGVRTGGEAGFVAHSWVEIGGSVAIGALPNLNSYSPILFELDSPEASTKRGRERAS